MKIESPEFGHNENIPVKYTCDGENINPPFIFRDVPEEARSLVFIADDPDAPRGTWVHWVLWNIPPDTKKIEGGEAPFGIEGATSFGKPGYGGPCPPSGTHRYFFKLYALKNLIDLDSSAVKADLETAMNGNIIASAKLVGLYHRISN